MGNYLWYGRMDGGPGVAIILVFAATFHAEFILGRDFFGAYC